MNLLLNWCAYFTIQVGPSSETTSPERHWPIAYLDRRSHRQRSAPRIQLKRPHKAVATMTPGRPIKALHVTTAATLSPPLRPPTPTTRLTQPYPITLTGGPRYEHHPSRSHMSLSKRGRNLRSRFAFVSLPTYFSNADAPNTKRTHSRAPGGEAVVV